MSTAYDTTSPSMIRAASLPVRISFLIVIALALWLRAPRIGEGLPFFYREDEAHHFNRLTEMVKEGRLDPWYFHKPSLHFYLRMPVVAASFFWTVSQGNIRSVQEIITRDDYGVGDYAFSASHPGIVKWNRAFSVLLGILTLLLSATLAARLSGSYSAALITAAIVAVCPPLISEGAVIGVDVLMTFMCLWCAWLAVRFNNDRSAKNIFLCALVAGLAISSKYNAAPIAAVPLLLATTGNYLPEWSSRARRSTVALLGIIIGFLAGTPFLFAHIPLFLDQVAYEVWHYGVAGHVGHMAEPGWEQLRFYLAWLNFEALGPLLTTFGMLGAGLLFFYDRARFLPLVTFPALYFFMMVFQKANFTRNMLVVLPFLAIIASIAFLQTLNGLRLQGRVRSIIVGAFVLIGLGYPVRIALVERADAMTSPESRRVLMEELSRPSSAPRQQIAFAGQLQFPPSFIASGAFQRFNHTSASLLEWYLRGFDLFVGSPALPFSEVDQALFPVRRRIAGEQSAQRIVQNPELELRSAEAGNALDAAALELVTKNPDFHLNVTLAGTTPRNCYWGPREQASSPTEDYCWIGARVALIQFLDLDTSLKALPGSEFVTISLEAMTPWSDNPNSNRLAPTDVNQKSTDLASTSASEQSRPGTTATFSLDAWQQSVSLIAHEWTGITLRVPLATLKRTSGLYVRTPIVRSPRLQGINKDERQLGIAVRNMRLR